MTVPGGSARPVITFRHELQRKAIHLSSAAIPVAYAWLFSQRVMLLLLVAACAVALAVEVGRRRSPAVASLFSRTVGPMLRSHETERAVGATWMLLSYLLVVAVAPKPAAIAGMCAVSLGDGVAALVGRAIGRVRLGTTGKSLEGAIACFLVTMAAAIGIAELGTAAAALAALVATLAELPRGPGDDNARVALATTAAAWVGMAYAMASSAVP